MNRKLLKIILVMFMMLFMVSVPSRNAMAATTTDGWNYNVIDKSYVEITGYSGTYPTDGSLAIPNEIEGYPVTSIGNQAFERCSKLTSIIIPNGVTRIGDKAFGACNNLTSVKIPNSVTSIGNGAFSSCRNLISIIIPNSVTRINEATFIDCHSLTSITIPNSVTSIGWSAFPSCGLTSIEIPNSVTSIDGYAFYNCSSLKNIIISNSVASIGVKAFDNCSSLTEVITYENLGGNNVKTYMDSNYKNITVNCLEPQAAQTAEASVVTLTPNAGADNKITLTVKDTAGNVDTSFTGSHDVIISGVSAAPDGSYGSFNGTKLTSSSQTISVSFTNGLATCNFALNNSERQSIEFTIYEVENKLTNTLNITPTARVISVSVPANGTYKAGDNLDFTVNFSGNVAVTGTPQLSAIIGNSTKTADYIGGSKTSVLVFRYIVQAGDNDSDGVTVNGLSLNSGTIKNTAGSDANLMINNIEPTAGVFVDTEPPTWADTYPKTGTTMSGSIELKVKTNESGNAYIVCLLSGSQAPSVQQVKEGKDASGVDSAANLKGSAVLTANNESILNITGLSSGTNYDLYFVAEDSLENLQTTAAKCTVSVISDCPLIYKESKKIDNGDGKYSIRFLATIDTLDTDEVGFVFSKSTNLPAVGDGKSKMVSTTKVYNSVTAMGETINASDHGGIYIIACTVNGIPASETGTTTLYIRTFSRKGTEIKYSEVHTVTVNDL